MPPSPPGLGGLGSRISSPHSSQVCTQQNMAQYFSHWITQAFTGLHIFWVTFLFTAGQRRKGSDMCLQAFSQNFRKIYTVSSLRREINLKLNTKRTRLNHQHSQVGQTISCGLHFHLHILVGKTNMQIIIRIIVVNVIMIILYSIYRPFPTWRTVHEARDIRGLIF